ncbi:MAG: gliding motility protein GldC [Bernardetiaceae bacterium]|jgi:gliding motility-associated protein GldC|nr:gliding motility protein GldC [Bernardetiaceae bacterium]
MKTSEIRFHIELDDQNVPEKIFWQATDGPGDAPAEAKALNLSLWDHQRKETLRIDLWAKDLPVDEMKRTVVDTIGGLADVVRRATNDAHMADLMENLCDMLVQHIKREHGGPQPQ